MTWPRSLQHLLAAAFVGLAQMAVAQSDFRTLQVAAEQALVDGAPERSVDLAQEMLRIAPDSYAALFVLALAQSDLDQHAAAAETAARAYAVAPDAAARVQSARLVASARFRLNQFARAEFWLRRAANDITTDVEAEAVVREYVRTINANPLTLNFTAYVAPSDNVNSGSDDGILEFEGIPIEFFLPEDQRALSGIAFGGSARADYRLSRDDVQTTRVGAFAAGETYALSSGARDLLESSPNEDVQDVTGRDFATLQLEAVLTHQRLDVLPFGGTLFSLTYGTYWQGEERLVNYRDTAFAQDFRTDVGTVNVRLSHRDQTALLDTLVDQDTYDAITTFVTNRANNDQIRYTLAYRYSDAGFENIYDEFRMGLGYRFAEPIWGTRLSTSLQIGTRNYDEFATTLDGRDDRFASLSVDAIFTDISYFGFSPSVSLSTSRTVSTAEEETSSVAQILFGIESNF